MKFEIKAFGPRSGNPTPGSAAMFKKHLSLRNANIDSMSKYHAVNNPNLVGTYPAFVKSGGGYVWDEVLEYRVWCHPESGAPDLYDGDDYHYAFNSYEEALEFSENNPGTESPLALILQEEHINEPQPSTIQEYSKQLQ